MKNFALSFAILGVSIATSALASSTTLQSQIGPSVWVQNNTVKLIKAELVLPETGTAATSIVGVLPFQSVRLSVPSNTLNYSVGVCWADNLANDFCGNPPKGSVSGLLYPEVYCSETIPNPTSVYVTGSQALYVEGAFEASPTLICAKRN